MKLLIKTIVGFAIAFFLLIPTCYCIDTVMTQINTASQQFSSATGLNVTSEVQNNTAVLSNVYMVVYSIWGISFIIFLIVVAFYGRREEDLYG